MENQSFDYEDFDQYSSSESCGDTAISVPKLRNPTKSVASAAAGSSRAKRETKVLSSMQQKFRELSSIIPGSELKDEDLMLDDTISYLKELQDRANILEQQNKKISVEKAWVCGDNDIGESSSSASIYQYKQALPEIKAKAQGKCVLIMVHCENRKGFLTKLLREIEKLHLNVENISSLPFGDYLLDITVTSQMSDEFSMSMKDLKRELLEALLQLTM